MPEINPAQTRIINTFVDTLVADKGLGAMGAEEQEVLKKDLQTKVEEQIEQAMLRALSDAQLVELEKLVDGGASDEDLGAFFENSGVDFAQAAEQAMSEFRQEFLSNVAEEV